MFLFYVFTIEYGCIYTLCSYEYETIILKFIMKIHGVAEPTKRFGRISARAFARTDRCEWSH